MIFGFFVSTTFHPVSTWGSTIRDDVPDSSYTDLGASLTYAAVGTFVGNVGITGCGILIAPDWVLTAPPILVNIAEPGTFTVDGNSYSSTALFTDPAWTGNALNGGDFELIGASQFAGLQRCTSDALHGVGGSPTRSSPRGLAMVLHGNRIDGLLIVIPATRSGHFKM